MRAGLSQIGRNFTMSRAIAKQGGGGGGELAIGTKATFATDSSAVRRPGTILAIGRNFVEHIEELKNEFPEKPVVFAKALSTLCRTKGIVRFPSALGEVHHELEIVLRIGQDLDVGEYDSVGLACIDEVTLGLDFTDRKTQSELKAKGLPWFLAKNFRDATYICSTAKRVHSGKESEDLLNSITFQLLKNNKQVQRGDVRHMIYSFDTVLKFLTRTQRLEAGDVIFTGTPAGVGPVKTGDVLRLQSVELGIDDTVEVKTMDEE